MKLFVDKACNVYYYKHINKTKEKKMRQKSEIKIVQTKNGARHVLFWEGRARPWQITVHPNGWEEGKGRMVSLKTEKATIERIEDNEEWQQKRFVEATRNWK